jgi:hypothetical protein
MKNDAIGLLKKQGLLLAIKKQLRVASGCENYTKIMGRYESKISSSKYC